MDHSVCMYILMCIFCDGKINYQNYLLNCQTNIYGMNLCNIEKTCHTDKSFINYTIFIFLYY